MGYGLFVVIVVKVVDFVCIVVCFVGDGDFQMICQEFGMVMQVGVQLIVLILNNGIYGMICVYQECYYFGWVSGMMMQNFDFVQFVQVYGYYVECVEKIEDFFVVFVCVCVLCSGVVLDLNIFVEVLILCQMFSQMCDVVMKMKDIV